MTAAAICLGICRQIETPVPIVSIARDIRTQPSQFPRRVAVQSDSILWLTDGRHARPICAGFHREDDVREGEASAEPFQMAASIAVLGSQGTSPEFR